VNGLGEYIDLIADQRLPERVKYPLQDCYRSGFGLFYVQDPSLLEFQRRFQEETQRNNLRTVFGVEAIPVDSQFRDVVDTHDYEPLRGVFAEYFGRLQRSKQLERYQFYQGYYLITLDGSEYFKSESIDCGLCLCRKKANGRLEYYHQIRTACTGEPGATAGHTVGS